MPVKKLVDAVIFGLGASAGKRAYEELEQKVEKALGLDEKIEEKKPETPGERAKREKREKAEREKAEKEAKKARAREERAVDDELAALKKRIKK
jgi:hypothetical protein